MAVKARLVLVLSMLLASASARSKPVFGKVISDSGIYLSNVSIESLPSSSTTISDEGGVFSFMTPIKDRKITFTLDGYHPVTLNIIPFKNNTEVELIKIIEVNYLDSINTSIKFILSREGENIISHKMDDILNRGLSRVESSIQWDNSIITYQALDGSNQPIINGASINEVDVLYGSVKINNITPPLDDLGIISDRGISEFIITNGGHSKFSALSESIHYLPKMDYENKLAISRYENSINSMGLDGYGSIGIKHATIVSGLKQRDHLSFYSDSSNTQISTVSRNYFSNIGLTNRKNLEISFSGFQNTKDRYNLKNQDSLGFENNTFITKVDQWSPLTGRIRIHGLYQDRIGINRNQLDSLDVNDKCRSLGFSVEKDFENYMVTFSTISKIINSSWNVLPGNLLVDRQNSILTWSIESFLDQHFQEAYVKDLKMVFSKERTTDVKDIASQVHIAPNYWDGHSFQISTKIMQQVDDDENSIYLSFGSSNKVPYLEDVIKNSVYSHNIYDQTMLSEEEKSSFELVFTKNNSFTKYNWSYFLELSVLNQLYKNKIKQIPVNGNSMTLPINSGKVNRSGLNLQIKLQPITHRFQFLSTLSYFGSSDFSKFQLLPRSVMKNQIFIHNRYFNLNLMALVTSKRSITYIDDSDLIVDRELKRDTNYCLQISKGFRYKMFNVILSLSGDNLNDNVILIDDIRINEKRYSFDVSVLIQ